MLISYTLATTSTAYFMMAFAPVQSIIADVYNVSASTVSSCVVFFLVSFVLFNFASISALENYGIAKTVSNSSLKFDSLYSLNSQQLEQLSEHGFDTSY